MGMFRITAAVARRPSLWPTALRQARRLVPPRWWTRAPRLPLPSRPYLHFRSLTQYGDAEQVAEADDVVAYLRWCAAWDKPT